MHASTGVWCVMGDKRGVCVCVDDTCTHSWPPLRPLMNVWASTDTSKRARRERPWPRPHRKGGEVVCGRTLVPEHRSGWPGWWFGLVGVGRWRVK